MAAEAKPSRDGVPFSGRFALDLSATVDFPMVLITGEGTGTASHLGRTEITKDVEILVTFEPCTAPDGQPGTVTLFTEEATLAAANGDILFVNSSGSSCHTATGDIIDATFEIVGGTGRFEGASGGGTEHVEVNDTTHTETTRYKGVLRR